MLSAQAANTPENAGILHNPQVRRGQTVRRCRVLVVEDQAVIAMEIEDILDELGAEVVGIAGTPEDAVNMAEVHRPDVVTMDINLGSDCDGIIVACHLYDRLRIPSIFISAYGSSEAMERAEPARPVAWISKPVARAELKEALERTPLRSDQ